MAFYRGHSPRRSGAWYLRPRIIPDRPDTFELGAFSDILIGPSIKSMGLEFWDFHQIPFPIILDEKLTSCCVLEPDEI